MGTPARGKWAEDQALAYLKSQGLKEIGRNYRSRHGEIDLIMMQQETLVFIEVRARTRTEYMDPVETIDGSKLQKLLLTGRHYLQRHPETGSTCRFDVVTLTGGMPAPSIDWIRNAFSA